MTSRDDETPSSNPESWDKSKLVFGPPRILRDKYKLGRMLGEGGMGAVYEAQHVELGLRVAVKLLNERYARDPKSLTRFRREARAAAAVNHPNIVRVMDTDTDEDGSPFLVMELLEGESLSSFLRRQRMLPPEIAVSIVSQLLAGLSFAHQEKIVHRDLKPGNIFLAREPDGFVRVKVLDFGISRFDTQDLPAQVTADGSLIGTPHFMSAEQVAGASDVDARADVYAAGVLLYRMITGRLPFESDSKDELYRRIREGNPIPPGQLQEVSPELEEVILKALHHDRNQRFESAIAFREALHQAQPGLANDASIMLEWLQGKGAKTESTPVTAGTSVRGVRRGHSQQFKKLSAWMTGAVVSILFVGTLYLQKDNLPLRTVADDVQPQGIVHSLHFGVTRYLPQKQVETESAALVEYLSEKLHREVQLVVVEDYLDLATLLESEDVDFASLSPYAYVRAQRRTPGITLLAKPVSRGGASYEGYIVARADAGVRHLKDLSGKAFCYVGPHSTSGYLYPRAVFQRIGMDPDAAFRVTRFTGDHLAALRAVYSGACDGAAVYANALFNVGGNGMSPDGFRILATTDRIPADAYCARNHLPAETTRDLQKALLALSPGSETSHTVLGASSLFLGFQRAEDSDYDSVREIERTLGMPKE